MGFTKALRSPPPVIRALPGVADGDDDDLLLPDHVGNIVEGKAFEIDSTNAIAPQPWDEWVAGNKAKVMADLSTKPDLEVRVDVVVVANRLSILLTSFILEDDGHHAFASDAA